MRLGWFSEKLEKINFSKTALILPLFFWVLHSVCECHGGVHGRDALLIFRG
jgi:hypothetical protein